MFFEFKSFLAFWSFVWIVRILSETNLGYMHSNQTLLHLRLSALACKTNPQVPFFPHTRHTFCANNDFKSASCTRTTFQQIILNLMCVCVYVCVCANRSQARKWVCSIYMQVYMYLQSPVWVLDTHNSNRLLFPLKCTEHQIVGLPPLKSYMEAERILMNGWVLLLYHCIASNPLEHGRMRLGATWHLHLLFCSVAKGLRSVSDDSSLMWWEEKCLFDGFRRNSTFISVSRQVSFSKFVETTTAQRTLQIAIVLLLCFSGHNEQSFVTPRLCYHPVDVNPPHPASIAAKYLAFVAKHVCFADLWFTPFHGCHPQQPSTK